MEGGLSFSRYDIPEHVDSSYLGTLHASVNRLSFEREAPPSFDSISKIVHEATFPVRPPLAVFIIHYGPFAVPTGYSLTPAAYISFLFRDSFSFDNRNEENQENPYLLVASVRSRNKIVMIFCLKNQLSLFSNAHPIFFKKQLKQKRAFMGVQRGIPFAPLGQGFAKYDENCDFSVLFMFGESTIQIAAVDEMHEKY